jgi:hypothetical protein
VLPCPLRPTRLEPRHPTLFSAAPPLPGPAPLDAVLPCPARLQRQPRSLVSCRRARTRRLLHRRGPELARRTPSTWTRPPSLTAPNPLGPPLCCTPSFSAHRSLHPVPHNGGENDAIQAGGAGRRRRRQDRPHHSGTPSPLCILTRT